MKLSIDVETYSKCRLKKAGMFRYAQHPSTRLLVMCYRVEDLPEVYTWLPHQPPPGIFELSSTHFAWNAGFEAAIWKEIMVKRHGFPEIRVDQWRDTMAISNYCGYPAALFKAAEALDAERKQAAGWRLINLLCKGEDGRGTPEDYEELYDYCRDDVRAEYSCWTKLPRRDLPEQEQRIWEMNLESSFQGTYIDIDLVNALVGIRDAEKEALNTRMNDLTGLNITQTGALVDWLRGTGMEIDSIAAPIVKGALEGELMPLQREVLEIRKDAAKTSVAKLDAILICLCDDNRIRGMVQYYAAATGRFAGRLVQLQNLPRGLFKVKEFHRVLALLYASSIGMLYGPMDFCSTLIRGCLVPSPGRFMYVGDYNAIEARIVAWLAGCLTLLDLFRSGADPYIAFAATVYDKPYEDIDDKERFLGKTAILGLGYQMGGPRFQQTCIDWGVGDPGAVMAKSTVRLFRETYPEIPQLWKNAFSACCNAVDNPGRIYEVGPKLSPVSVGVSGGTLICRLPSGRTIMYPEVKKEIIEKEWANGDKSMVVVVTHMGIDSVSKKWVRKQLYGGRIVENWSQGIARDVMGDAMTRLKPEGFDLLFTVHDELVTESDDDQGLKGFQDLMEQPPKWGPDIPLRVGADRLVRYQK